MLLSEVVVHNFVGYEILVYMFKTGLTHWRHITNLVIKLGIGIRSLLTTY